jgi:hypothetical protein
MQTENRNSLWILKGLFWGFFMFLVMAIATPYAEGIQLQPDQLLIKFFIWMVAGLACGYSVHWIERKKG